MDKTTEALRMALEALEDRASLMKWQKARDAVKEALTQPEQEPVAWREFIEQVAKQKPEKPDYWSSCSQCERNINDAEDLLEAIPPQRTERPVDCERCNRLEEQAYDLVGKLRVANIKLSMQPQRTFVGLTDKERDEICLGDESIARAIEAKLKEKNT